MRDFERHPLELEEPGGEWVYRGRMRVRPVGRGTVLNDHADGTRGLEAVLPDGNYEVEIRVRRADHGATLEGGQDFLALPDALWDAVEAEFGLLTETEVDEVLEGGTAPRPDFHEILSAMRRQRRVFPGFQFDRSTGDIYPWAAYLEMLSQERERSTEMVVRWMMTPSAHFRGERPVDHVDEAQRVIDAAEVDWALEPN